MTKVYKWNSETQNASMWQVKLLTEWSTYDTNTPLQLKKPHMCKYYEENQVCSYGKFDDDMSLESVLHDSQPSLTLIFSI